MNYFRCLICLVLIGSVAIFGCGKKKKAIKDEGQVAQQGAQQDVVTDEEIPFKEMIEAAGFEVKVFKKFTAQEQNVKGRILVYAGKKNTGGVIYFKKTGTIVSPAWHWYFTDFAVDSVDAVELNEDGLWDVRMTDAKNKVRTFIQEETFTLSAKPREDFIALNGTSIPPGLPGYELWKCFDGDTETSWQADLDGKAGVVLEFPVPFGVKEGILSIETSTAGQPKECDVYADGKRIDQLKFEEKAGRQLFRLSEAASGATEIRIVFTASYDDRSRVAVAELGLK